jgi:hypothetical protein
LKKKIAKYFKRVGRSDVELEREADNIFHQKSDPAFKQEFTTNSKGEKQITAYYINHSPYSLTKVNQVLKGYDFKSINGDYVNSETNTILSLIYIDGMSYRIKLGKSYKTIGMLVSYTKMLVDSYSLELRNGELFLNGERMKEVKYVRK